MAGKKMPDQASLRGFTPMLKKLKTIFQMATDYNSGMATLANTYMVLYIKLFLASHFGWGFSLNVSLLDY